MLSELCDRIGFTKTPANLGDGGIAFAAFLRFASGPSGAAATLRKAFADQHTNPEAESPRQHVAAFIDWLIVNHWGEEPKAEA